MMTRPESILPQKYAMKHLWNSALGLLLVTGGLLGLTLPFGKIATEAGIPAILWAFVISLRRRRRPSDRAAGARPTHSS